MKEVSQPFSETSMVAEGLALGLTRNKANATHGIPWEWRYVVNVPRKTGVLRDNDSFNGNVLLTHILYIYGVYSRAL